MRCCVLAVIVSTLWLPTCRAQEPPGSMNSAAGARKNSLASQNEHTGAVSPTGFVALLEVPPSEA